MSAKQPTTKEQLERIILSMENLSKLNDLVEIVPDIKELVEERKEQEIFNKRAAKIGRWIVVIMGGVGTAIGAMWAVSKLIFTLGSNQ
jgi:hypothetical protein